MRFYCVFIICHFIFNETFRINNHKLSNKLSEKLFSFLRIVNGCISFIHICYKWKSGFYSDVFLRKEKRFRAMRLIGK